LVRVVILLSEARTQAHWLLSRKWGNGDMLDGGMWGSCPVRGHRKCRGHSVPLNELRWTKIHQARVKAVFLLTLPQIADMRPSEQAVARAQGY
jgi:hypothetical protein